MNKGYRLRRTVFAGCLLAVSMCISAAAQSEVGATTSAVPDVISERLRLEESTRGSQWVITPMRPNYLMPLTYISPINKKPWRSIGEDTKYDNVEVKFQISFKLAVWEDMWSPGSDLFFGYTQVSVWQAYNRDESSPFRDTNYEPEFFVSMKTDNELLGLHNRNIIVGAVHQSNGRGSESLSRSWNRIYANALLERGNLALSIKPWYRIPEDEEDDNNPNIEKYLGYGELRAAYKSGSNLFAATGRNNLRADGNKGAIQLDWSFPLGPVRGFVQYFAGYGETLLDYDHYQQRIGFGVMLSDWL